MIPMARRVLSNAAIIAAIVIAWKSASNVAAQPPLQVGYAVFIADSGSRIPMGSGLFRVTNSAGVPVSEAGMGAADPFRTGRVFVDNVPLAAVTLRESQNVQGESLYSTLPVVDLSAPLSSEQVVFPDIAAGGGYTTEILLMNPGADTLVGDVRFFGSSGEPLSLRDGGTVTTQIGYQIAGITETCCSRTASRSGCIA